MPLPTTSPATTTVGWIGTGLMGRYMAGHLLRAGYPLVVNTRTRSKADELLAAGARWADDPARVAAEADVVVTMVGLPSDVEGVLLGERGALLNARAGQLFIDMSTSRPSLAKELARAAEARGAFAIDAPVSGGQAGARDATLSIMVGGADAAVQAALPLSARSGRASWCTARPAAGSTPSSSTRRSSRAR